jgi:bacteriorhodopsin
MVFVGWSLLRGNSYLFAVGAAVAERLLRSTFLAPRSPRTRWIVAGVFSDLALAEGMMIVFSAGRFGWVVYTASVGAATLVAILESVAMRGKMRPTLLSTTIVGLAVTLLLARVASEYVRSETIQRNAREGADLVRNVFYSQWAFLGVFGLLFLFVVVATSQSREPREGPERPRQG